MCVYNVESQLTHANQLTQAHLISMPTKYELAKEIIREWSNEWLTWCITNQHVSISSNDVPENILPEDWFGVLLDCKVFCKEGPDDVLFNENADIRRMVARGNCFLKLRSPEWVVETSHVLRGLPKFCEGLGEAEGESKKDEDDKWKDYFTKDIAETSYILSSNKLNGESGHMAALLIHGTPYWLGGSKNVSMLFRNRDDIKKYASAQRYSIAMEICEEWMGYVDDHHHEAGRLHSFMCEYKLTGNFEFLSPHHQHIEDFSHMPQLIFITWTFLNLESVLEKPITDQPTSSSSSPTSSSSSS
ncbi:hypothetical protein HELRODRAFT_195070, partial [Helobdella robusta]|uniref:Uncharacterized protein n=1 Tax=Helobdella robusta TaxID=6412 RepID=T1FWQ3_HELRO